MAVNPDKYKVDNIPVKSVLTFLEEDLYVIPIMQRRFVWEPGQVRDLINSLYMGFPIGYLITWHSPSTLVRDGKTSDDKQILIDGQQRVTALKAAILGKKIITDEYIKRFIKIAFNPFAKKNEELFVVSSQDREYDSKWIPDISKVFDSRIRTSEIVNDYVGKNPNVNPGEVEDKIEQLKEIVNRQLGLIKLHNSLSIEEVTEIFVRVNSQGTPLNESNFAMSKLASDQNHGGQEIYKVIDYFCNLAKQPRAIDVIRDDSEFANGKYFDKIKWCEKLGGKAVYIPELTDMLRVSFMYKFNRGKLRDLVRLLSGRDFSTRQITEERKAETFKTLSSGIDGFINKDNFIHFVDLIKAAGFISPNLLKSKSNLNFAYTLFLLLRDSNQLSSKVEIQGYVQKWFVLSTLTRRYSTSQESQMSTDLRRISTIGIVQLLEETNATLGESFWKEELVQGLETPTKTNPIYLTYLAAQIKLQDHVLLDNSHTVTNLIESGNVHHIFPKQFLCNNKFDKQIDYNQVANYAYLESTTNKMIGAEAPAEYFKEALDQCSSKEMKIGRILDTDEFWKNLKANCIPKEILDMKASDYPDFLKKRRQLMVEKIKDYYDGL